MEKENRTFCPLDRKNTGDTILKGSIGEMEQRILKRLQGPEFNEQFLIADLDFNQERWFTNYSGDISGRFLEIMSLAGKGDPDYHSALSFMLKRFRKTRGMRDISAYRLTGASPLIMRNPQLTEAGLLFPE